MSRDGTDGVVRGRFDCLRGWARGLITDDAYPGSHPDADDILDSMSRAWNPQPQVGLVVTHLAMWGKSSSLATTVVMRPRQYPLCVHDRVGELRQPSSWSWIYATEIDEVAFQLLGTNLGLPEASVNWRRLGATLGWGKGPSLVLSARAPFSFAAMRCGLMVGPYTLEGLRGGFLLASHPRVGWAAARNFGPFDLGGDMVFDVAERKMLWNGMAEVKFGGTRCGLFVDCEGLCTLGVTRKVRNVEAGVGFSMTIPTAVCGTEVGICLVNSLSQVKVTLNDKGTLVGNYSRVLSGRGAQLVLTGVTELGTTRRYTFGAQLSSR